MKTKIYNRLSIKLIISISIILILILSLHTYLTVSKVRENLTEFRLATANNLSDIIRKSTRYSMLHNQRQDVHEIIKTIGTEEGVKGIRIYNKLGTIIYSTNPAEIFQEVDYTAEACIVCHNQSEPLIKLEKESKSRIYLSSDNVRLLGLINPIYNEKDCYSADCHAHDKKTEVLGVLDVILTMDQLDVRIEAITDSTITNSIVITLAISLLSGLFIIVFVNRPLGKLKKGIDEIGSGNLSYKIEELNKDELGEVGRRFNEMSVKLDAAYREIKDWSENLNKKVEEKSEELKNIYNQVNQIEKLASLGKLSATVAHELNNPLAGILTYSKLVSKKLKEKSLNGEHDKLTNYLDLISEESSRCGRIVKDLLLFSHKGDELFSTEKLSDIINKSILLINHHLEIHHATLDKTLDDTLYIYCNPQKLQQALMSILINAIESMTNGGAIFISTKKNDGKVILLIKDQGTGIDKKDLPHIFEPFYSTKEASKGTGLGLSVAYGIINHHNGRIEVEDTSIRGTTFKITLPLKNNN